MSVFIKKIKDRILDKNKLITVYILIPIFLLAVVYGGNLFIHQVENSLLLEKFTDLKNTIDMINFTTSATPEDYWDEHEKSVIASVEFIDAVPCVFAGLYKQINGEWIQVSERNHDTTFDPWKYQEFKKIAENRFNAEMQFEFTPESGEPILMRLYFSHAPNYTPIRDTYVIVGAVSKNSINTEIPSVILKGTRIFVGICITLYVFLLFMTANLSYYWLEKKSMKGKKNSLI